MSMTFMPCGLREKVSVPSFVQRWRVLSDFSTSLAASVMVRSGISQSVSLCERFWDITREGGNRLRVEKIASEDRE